MRRNRRIGGAEHEPIRGNFKYDAGAGKKDNTAPIQIGVMESATTCAIGALKLSGSDLLIAEHLKPVIIMRLITPHLQRKIKYIHRRAKKGDKVAVYRVSDELYIILERLV